MLCKIASILYNLGNDSKKESLYMIDTDATIIGLANFLVHVSNKVTPPPPPNIFHPCWLNPQMQNC